jgi:hypothetical protein
MHDNNALKDSKRNQDYNKELDILTTNQKKEKVF